MKDQSESMIGLSNFIWNEPSQTEFKLFSKTNYWKWFSFEGG